MTLSYASTKEKVPHDFSYCVQRSDIDVSFGGDADIPLSISFVRFRTRNLLDTQFWATPIYGRCPVLSLRYWVPSWPSTCWSRDNPRGISPWHLYVYAVPKPLRSHIRQICTSQHLPALNAWLSERRPETWHVSNHRKTAFFDPSTREVTLQDEDDF